MLYTSDESCGIDFSLSIQASVPCFDVLDEHVAYEGF